MANSNSPFGALPVRHGNGNPWNGMTNRYLVPSADGSAYYIGDVVISAAGADANGVSAVAKATAGQTARGIIVGVEVAPPNAVSLQGTALSLETLTIPATKTRDYYVYVCDDPDVVFEIQGDGTGTNQVAVNANKNAQLTIAAPSAGSLSATVINSSTIAVTQAHNIKLMGLAQRSTNAFGAYAVWLAKFNQHELMGNTAGI